MLQHIRTSVYSFFVNLRTAFGTWTALIILIMKCKIETYIQSTGSPNLPFYKDENICACCPHCFVLKTNCLSWEHIQEAHLCIKGRSSEDTGPPPAILYKTIVGSIELLNQLRYSSSHSWSAFPRSMEFMKGVSKPQKWNVESSSTLRQQHLH